jgi:hypothetical protein
LFLSSEPFRRGASIPKKATLVSLKVKVWISVSHMNNRVSLTTNQTTLFLLNQTVWIDECLSEVHVVAHSHNPAQPQILGTKRKVDVCGDSVFIDMIFISKYPMIL